MAINLIGFFLLLPIAVLMFKSGIDIDSDYIESLSVNEKTAVTIYQSFILFLSGILFEMFREMQIAFLFVALLTISANQQIQFGMQFICFIFGLSLYRIRALDDRKIKYDQKVQVMERDYMMNEYNFIKSFTKQGDVHRVELMLRYKKEPIYEFCQRLLRLYINMDYKGFIREFSTDARSVITPSEMHKLLLILLIIIVGFEVGLKSKETAFFNILNRCIIRLDLQNGHKHLNNVVAYINSENYSKIKQIQYSSEFVLKDIANKVIKSTEYKRFSLRPILIYKMVIKKHITEIEALQIIDPSLIKVVMESVKLVEDCKSREISESELEKRESNIFGAIPNIFRCPNCYLIDDCVTYICPRCKKFILENLIAISAE